MPAAIIPYRGGSRRMLPDKKCPVCLRMFRPRGGKNTVRCCSHECRLKHERYGGFPKGTWLKPRPKRYCAGCGVEISYTYPCDKNKYCTHTCYTAARTGKKDPPEVRVNKQRAQDLRRKKPSTWRVFLRNLRRSAELVRWRKRVFRRDDYTCASCGVRGGKLHSDHLLPFAAFPQYATDPRNGLTLCEECHHSTETYGNRWWRRAYFVVCRNRTRLRWKKGLLELNQRVPRDSQVWNVMVAVREKRVHRARKMEKVRPEGSR